MAAAVTHARKTRAGSVTLKPKWWDKADAAVDRGQASSRSDFLSVALEQAEAVGVPILEAVNDIGVPPHLLPPGISGALPSRADSQRPPRSAPSAR